MRSADKLLGLLADRHVVPYKTSHRLDGTTSLYFCVDDRADRYVRAEDSVESDDFVVTCRNFREVKVVVAGDVLEVVDVVMTGLAHLYEASKAGWSRAGSSRPAPPASDESGGTRVPSAVLELFAHTSGVFLEDWHSGRLLAQEVCETLWAAAKARNIVRLVGVTRPNGESKNG